MNEDMLKLIKKGIMNYYNTLIAINIKEIMDYLTVINSQLVIDNRYRIEFRIEDLVLSYYIVDIEKGSIHCELVGTLEPSQRFYPLKLIVSNMVFAFSDGDAFYKYLYNIIETPNFGMVFCKYFPDVVKKINENA